MPPKKEKGKFVCLECNKEFYLLPCQAKRGRGKYCSKGCLGKSKRHGSELFCALCDSPFYRRFGEQDKDKRINQFCSKACYSEWRALHRSPETYLKCGHRHAHRVTAESVLGRPLSLYEVVHHIDGNKQNNHPSNLAVFPNQALHVKCHQGGLTKNELRRFSLQ